MKTTRKTAAVVSEAGNTGEMQAITVPDEFVGKVAEAAYFIAEQRGFAPGYEMEDWLAAETQIRQQFDMA